MTRVNNFNLRTTTDFLAARRIHARRIAFISNTLLDDFVCPRPLNHNLSPVRIRGDYRLGTFGYFVFRTTIPRVLVIVRRILIAEKRTAARGRNQRRRTRGRNHGRRRTGRKGYVGRTVSGIKALLASIEANVSVRRFAIRNLPANPVGAARMVQGHERGLTRTRIHPHEVVRCLTVLIAQNLNELGTRGTALGGVVLHDAEHRLFGIHLLFSISEPHETPPQENTNYLHN